MTDIRALVVDDEQLAREELCFLLGQAGGVDIVGQASDGVEALRIIGELKPDVAFLDVQMPGLTGFEVARRLIQIDAPPGTTMVFARDMKESLIMLRRYWKSMPLGLAKRITTMLSSGDGMSRAMNGFDVSTIGTRWKFTCVCANCGQM